MVMLLVGSLSHNIPSWPYSCCLVTSSYLSPPLLRDMKREEKMRQCNGIGNCSPSRERERELYKGGEGRGKEVGV